MKVIRASVAAVMLAAAMTSIAAADEAPPPGAPGPMGGMHGGRGGHFGPQKLFEKLGLSADQKARVDAIFAAKGPGLKSLHEQMRGNMEKLHQLSADDPDYAATVSQLAQASGATTTQLISAEGDLRAQLNTVLTPAQKTQLKALEAKMIEHMKEGGGRGREGGWGHHPPMPDAPPDAPPPN